MSASKFNTEPNGGIFDISPENDGASPNVKTPQCGALVSQVRRRKVLTRNAKRDVSGLHRARASACQGLRQICGATRV